MTFPDLQSLVECLKHSRVSEGPKAAKGAGGWATWPAPRAPFGRHRETEGPLQSGLHWQNFSQKFWVMMQGQVLSQGRSGWSQGW